jgi:hypothetical protein
MRRPRFCNINATRDRDEFPANRPKKIGEPQNEHRFAETRTLWCNSGSPSTTDCDAHGPHISACVEGPQRDRMLPS